MKTNLTTGHASVGLRSATRSLAFCLAVFTYSVAEAADEIELGRALVEENCARCHAIGSTGESPFEPAPPFRSLKERYPIESLEEALAEGIVSGHPAMPEFTFDPDQVGAIIAYLKSL